MTMYVCMYRMCEGEPVKPLIVFASDETEAYTNAMKEIIEKEGHEPFSIKIISNTERYK